MDYLSENADGPTTVIVLHMVPAKDKQNYLPVNPGGPDGSGMDIIERAGAKIRHVVGDSFDIPGFDQRGTNAGVPRANCFTCV